MAMNYRRLVISAVLLAILPATGTLTAQAADLSQQYRATLYSGYLSKSY